MLLFDSHVHVGVSKIENAVEIHSNLPAYNNATSNSLRDFFRLSQSKGVTKCLAFPFPFKEIKREAANKYLLECARKEPALILPLLLPDHIKNIEARINEIYGVKEHFYLENNNDLLFPIYDLIQNAGKVLLIHVHKNEWKKKISEISSNFPNLNVIIAHSARTSPFSDEGLIENVKNILSVSKTKDNLYFETSTIRVIGNTLTELMDVVGNDHILWGSDFPFYRNKNEDVYKLECDFVSSAPITEEHKKKIFSQNFRRLFQQNDIWVRYACEHDSKTLINMFESISEPEKKLLAINAKLPLLNQVLRRPKHILLAENRKEQILGFIRTSDRPGNGAFIEEVYVPVGSRGLGIGRLLIESAIKGLCYAEMKTYSSNDPMVNIAKKLGFIASFTPKKTMINWKLG